MSQFSAAGKPPWARDALGQPGVAVVNNLGQAQLSVPANQGLLQQPAVANQTVYSLATTPMATAQAQYSNQQMGLQNLQATMQQASAALQQLPQPGIAMPTTLASSQVQTVSYPAPRTQVPPGGGAKQRVFTGTVTKLHDNFGFVDEDVFFQTSCVKGTVPKVGDRVLVEASYNANMPFKWNATRIQTVGGGQQQVNTVKPQQVGRMGTNPPPLMAQSVAPQSGNNRAMGNRDFAMPNNMGGGRDRDRGRDRDKDRSERRSSPRRRSPARKRSRSPKRRSRSRSPRRSSPRRRVARMAPRYTVTIPKITLDTKEANVIALRSRYNNMYIPSDFFNATFPWTEAFPLHRPFPLGHPCNFQVMHKEVDPIVPNVAVLEPPDADHLYSAKVMLLASPTMEELYHKSCALAEDPSDQRDNFQHPTRLVNFLVGLKGKEPMAIGGPWSPSLDGANPNEDPRVLINTAIRTTRALTGIDLSACTQWFRFAEIRYHRPEEMHKGRLVPARVETVLIFLPDVWSCNPSRLEWDGLAVAYKRQLAEKCKEDQAEDTQEEEEEPAEASETKPDPTHHAQLDPKTMKVTDLRRELDARSLSTKGLKSQLIARLTKTLKNEQETEEQKAGMAEEEKEEEPKPEEPKEPDEKDDEKKKREEEERKRREERERAVRERRYTLAGGPSVLVHPSTTAKQGKFDCTNMSLSVLLDYRHDDNKEHTFEVSLFAELFNEMLMRDFGFEIYKALVKAPEKPKEEKKDRKDKDKKDKDKKDEKDKKEEKDDKEKKDEKKDEKKEEKKEEDNKEKSEEKKEEDTAEPPAKKKKEDEKESSSKDKKRDEKKDEKGSKDDDEDKKEKDKSSKDGENDDNDDDKKSVSSSRRSRDREDRDRDRRRKEEKKEKEKMHTILPHLLLAFSYYDQSHTGYLQDKDCEEILHTLGLFLSRSQIKKLVSKVVSKESVYYRKLTDISVKEKEEKEKKEAAAAESAMETDENAEKEKEVKEEPVIDEETLGKGNKPLLPEKPFGAATPGKRSAGAKKSVEAGNLIMYNGAMLDIASMVQRLDKSEKTKHETDDKLKDLQEEMDMLKDSCKSSEQNSQKVALELQELKKKLRDQRKVTERAEADAKKYYEALANVKGNLTTSLDTLRSVTEKTTSSSSTPSKSSSSSTSAAEASDVKVEIKKEVNGDGK